MIRTYLYPDVNFEIRRTVTDEYGRYYALVPPGNYFVTIETRNPDNTYTKVFKSEGFKTSQGSIDKHFEINPDEPIG